MVLLLAEQLEVPVRERNQLLLAAGHAPAIPERSLGDPELAPVREGLDLIRRPAPAPALPGGRRRPRLEPGRRQLRDGGRLAAWVDPVAAGAAGQRDAGRFASAGIGPLDH